MALQDQGNSVCGYRVGLMKAPDWGGSRNGQIEPRASQISGRGSAGSDRLPFDESVDLISHLLPCYCAVVSESLSQLCSIVICPILS